MDAARRSACGPRIAGGSCAWAAMVDVEVIEQAELRSSYLCQRGRV
jgi:hypothetical protein